MRRWFAYRGLLTAVREEIRRVYATYLFHEPSGASMREHLRGFQRAFPALEAAREAIRAGTFLPHLGIRPLKLEMDVVNQCNLRCIMCHFSNEAWNRRKKEEIPVEAFARIAAQVFPLCSQLSLSIGNEPLLHRQLGELLAITARYRVPWVYMHTNGLLLHGALIERLIDAGVNQISISIDAATPQTYEKIRVGGKFEKLIANIEALNHAKERRRSPTPHLCFNVVLMRSNIEELPAIVRLARDLRVSGVAAVHMMHFPQAVIDPAVESLQHHQALCNQMLAEAREVAAKLSVPLELPEPFAQKLLPVRSRHRDLKFLPVASESRIHSCCAFPWHFVGIAPDGWVAPCGWWHGGPPMGNIQTETFEQIWTRGYAVLRAELQSGRLRPLCRDCPAAGMGSIDDTRAFATRSA